MNILVTGATGFVGRHLVPVLLREKHRVTIVGRDAHKMQRVYKNSVNGVSWQQLDTLDPDQFDAMINLAGENIAEHRWTEKTKQSIKASRVNATTQLVNWSLKAKNNKPHLYNASAIGVYGLQATSRSLPPVLTEASLIAVDKPTDFLSEVGQVWESATIPANVPVTLMRFAVVLKRNEGVLKKLQMPFSLGLGTILGSGQQAFSWIHIDDLVRAILFLLAHPDIQGPVNLSAPTCVSQREFATILADAMHRPLFLTMPAFMVNLLFGQMGRELLLGGQHVYPERLEQLGFKFLYPDLPAALAHEWH